MAHVISIATPISNSGKTTTAINLAVSLSILEKNTLLVDCDPWQQVGAGTSLMASSVNSPGFYSVMTDRCSIGDVILKSALNCLNILPAGADFSKADFLFGDTDGDIYKLRDLIQGVMGYYDYIVINAPAEMPHLLKTVLIASGWLVIPFNTDFTTHIDLLYRFSDMKNLFKLVMTLREQFQLAPRVAGILLNRCGPIEDISEKFSLPVLESISEFILSTRIPIDKDISEGFSQGKPAAFQNIMSEGAIAFMDLAEELIEKIH